MLQCTIISAAFAADVTLFIASISRQPPRHVVSQTPALGRHHPRPYERKGITQFRLVFVAGLFWEIRVSYCSLCDVVLFDCFTSDLSSN